MFHVMLIRSALLCFKWSELGLVDGWDTGILTTLLATHVTVGFMYARKGDVPVTASYWVISLLMVLAALRQK